jgi:threonylcarbamoyladenosine tRNA methylthiotransferase MtaB
MRVYVTTLGCRLNFSEMERLARELAARGHHVVNAPDDADLCVLNTCAVTTLAEAKSRSLARALARSNSRAPLALTGCYATLAPEPARRLPQVQLVVANDEKDRLADILDAWAGEVAPADLTQPDCSPLRCHTHARLHQGSGWLQQPLHVLHRQRGARSRTQPPQR